MKQTPIQRVIDVMEKTRAEHAKVLNGDEYDAIEYVVEHNSPVHLLKILIETYESAVLEEPELPKRKALENMYWSLKHAMVELQSREGN